MIIELGTVGVEGSPALWDPSSTNSIHSLVTGMTGGGKTHLTIHIVTQALCDGAEVWIADGKAGGDYNATKPDRLGNGSEEVTQLLLDAANEVERRLTVLRHDVTSRNTPLFIVVDELSAAQLRRRNEDVKSHRDRRELIQGALSEIALTARSANVHLWLVTQRGDVESIPGGGSVRDQLGLRISMGWNSPQGYQMMWPGVDLRPPFRAEPGWGYISGYVGHREGPRLFFASEGDMGNRREFRHTPRLPWRRRSLRHGEEA